MQLINQLTDIIQNTLDEHRHLSESTLRAERTVLKGIYEYAMSRDYVTKDYSAFCKYTTTTAPKQIHKIFTSKELSILWNHQDDDIAKMILIMIYTGLRIEEYLKLDNDNIHLNERYIIAGLKTTAGINRMIPICNCIHPLIKDLTETGNNSFFRHRTQGRVRDKIKTYTHEILGIEHLPHDTRHTFATLMFEAKADETVTKVIIGHKIDDVTRGTYTTISLEQRLNEINKINP